MSHISRVLDGTDEPGLHVKVGRPTGSWGKGKKPCRWFAIGATFDAEIMAGPFESSIHQNSAVGGGCEVGSVSDHGSTFYRRLSMYVHRFVTLGNEINLLMYTPPVKTSPNLQPWQRFSSDWSGEIGGSITMHQTVEIKD